MRLPCDFRAFTFLDLTHRAFTQRLQRMMIQSARIIFLHATKSIIQQLHSQQKVDLLDLLSNSHVAPPRNISLLYFVFEGRWVSQTWSPVQSELR